MKSTGVTRIMVADMSKTVIGCPGAKFEVWVYSCVDAETGVIGPEMVRHRQPGFETAAEGRLYAQEIAHRAGLGRASAGKNPPAYQVAIWAGRER